MSLSETNTRWNGLGNEDEYLKLKEKFLKHLNDEKSNEGKSANHSGAPYTFQQAPRAIQAESGKESSLGKTGPSHVASTQRTTSRLRNASKGGKTFEKMGPNSWAFSLSIGLNFSRDLLIIFTRISAGAATPNADSH